MGDVSITETTGGFTPDQKSKIGKSALGPKKPSFWKSLGRLLGITALVGGSTGAIIIRQSEPFPGDTPTKVSTPQPTRALTPEDQAIVKGIQESADKQNDAVKKAMDATREALIHPATTTPAASVTPTGPSGGK